MGSTLAESKKEVLCGICEEKYTARRGYVKYTHFPKKHPGQQYIERGERPITFASFQPPRPTQNVFEKIENKALGTRKLDGFEPNVVNESHGGDEGVTKKQLLEKNICIVKPEGRQILDQTRPRQSVPNSWCKI